ncbi:MAG: succinyl-diaminopimelate desuccinylase, partial [Pseudomonadota bacterium]
MSDPVALAQALIRCPSVTPADEGALTFVEEALKPLGFDCHRLSFAEVGYPTIDNVYARLGTEGPLFCYAGHTDVVPPGPLEAWSVDPFAGEIVDDMLIGRGACDMKGSVAAFLAAVSRFVEKRGNDFGGSIGLIITGDEEAHAVNGTPKILQWMQENGERPYACLVGEPTSHEQVGDMIKIGRRGSMTLDLTVAGVQGHTAYPHKADNAANRLVRMLNELVVEPLDEGSHHFDPTNLEITTIDIGNPAANVIPSKAHARVNIRFNDHHSGESLEGWVRGRLDHIGGDYDLSVRISGESFVTEPGDLSDIVSSAIKQVTNQTTALSTTGGTSDARFIKDYCPVVECGLVNHT